MNPDEKKYIEVFVDFYRNGEKAVPDDLECEYILKSRKIPDVYIREFKSYLRSKSHTKELEDLDAYDAWYDQLTYETIDDIDVKQRIASISYMYLSKALNEAPENANCAKFRVMLLDYCKEPLQYTAMSALNLCGGFGLMSLGAMPELRSRDALYMMKYYDLKSFPILRMHNEFFQNIENDLDAKIAQHFFGAKTKDEVFEEGRNNHAKMLDFIENQVLEDEDIDF